MDIRYRQIEHGIWSDAPFIGSRISGISCSHNCRGCCNQHLLQSPILLGTTDSVILDVLEHHLSKGIIFGGLEWTEQPEELVGLALAAREAKLEVMVYTHLDINTFLMQFKPLWHHRIYVKCGEYQDWEKSYYDEKHDVLLASRNQQIYRLDQL